MGLFDKMFGSEAKAALQNPNAQQRFDQLKEKYQSVLRVIEQQNVQLQNLHVQDNKLYMKGTAPSEQAKNAVWNEIKLVNPQYDDITADITVVQQSAQAAAAGASQGAGSAQGAKSYTVKPGDSLSKISEQFYGDAHQYMQIFYANRDKLTDPDKVQVGQVLVIPPKQQSQQA